MNSVMKELIIKIENERVLFTPDFFININQTNIPKAHISFKPEIFWKVEMLEFGENESCLKVKLLDYQSKDIEKFKTQKLKKSFKKLVFDGKYEWSKLQPLLYSYTVGRMLDYLIENKVTIKPVEYSKPKRNQFAHFSNPFISTIEDTFSIEFTEATFKLGYITFEKKIKSIGQTIEFKILNEHILPEFDYIKFWFCKSLKTKRFTVKIVVELINNQIKTSNATSKQIDLINKELLDSIKFLRTYAITKEPKIKDVDKALFTSSTIYSQFELETTKGNIFQQTDEDILEFLIEKAKVRNRKEIAYLSKEIQPKNQPLRYTLHPNFGFPFTYEGEKNTHFIWELLNSHATYIWSIGKGEKEFSLQLKRIEDIINTIRVSGRETYKRAFKNNHQDSDLVFKVLNHKDIGSNFKDEFVIWRSKLDEQLI